MMFPPMTVSQQDERQNVRRDAAAFFFFVLITVWLTWPLVARLDSGLSSAADALLNYWALGWDFHILPRDPLALFDANIFSPRKDTLAYSEHMFGIAVVVWPFYLVTGNLTIAYNAAILLSFVLSGLGMYLLVRDLTKSRLAAVVAGTIFLAAPYRFLHLVHVQLLTLQWFPFVFWSLSRFLRDGRPRQLVAVVLFSLLQLLSCNYYAVYLAFAIIVFGLVVLTAGRELLSKKKIFLLGGGAIVVFVVALPFILPYQRNREQGFYRRYEDVVHFSASASDYANPSSFNKAPHFQWLRRRARSEKALLPGFAAMGLAAFGLYFGWKAAKGDPLRRTFWLFFVFLSLAAGVMSLGPELRFGDRVVHLPYRFFYRYVPGFGGIRVPARISVLALLGGAALAGWGTAGLLRRAPRFGTPLGFCIIGFLLFEYQTYSLGRVSRQAPRIPEAHRWLAKEPSGGAVLVLPIHEGEDIIHESVYMYYSTVHWKPLVNGYSGWWPNDYWELVGRLRHFPTARSLRFLLERAPVRYVVIHYDRIPQPRRRQLEAAMYRYRERMPVRFRLGNDVVYEIVSEDDPPS